ncbi:MAG: hypothetical protein QF718_00285 [Phycisphaerales bacterium]|nr:hypothetical protein [Phycisphaerales bacterium]
MDFLPEQEINELLHEFGITTKGEGDTCVLLEMSEDQSLAKHCLDNEGCLPCGSDEQTVCYTVAAEELGNTVCGAIHKIHQGQTILIPCGKWRSVFDAVAFSMANDELWQEFDASATIKLNTRDPLLFEASDEQILLSLITALMNDAETQEQSVFLIPAGAPLLIHVQPGGPVKFWFGNNALADEVREVYTN